MRKNAIGVATAIILASAGALASTVAANASDDPTSDGSSTTSDQVEVSLVTANGSGCPSGIAGVSVRYDGGVSVTFGEMESLVISGTATPATLQANCQLSLAITVPEGMTYAATGIATTVRASLADKVTATVKQSLYIQGSSQTNTVDNTLTGPVDTTVEVSGSIADDELVFAPCDATRNLNVNTRIVLSASELATDAWGSEVAIVDGMRISLETRKC